LIISSAPGVEFPKIDAWLATEWISPLSLFINWARKGFKWALGTLEWSKLLQMKFDNWSQQKDLGL
jgi:hypothetical protein